QVEDRVGASVVPVVLGDHDVDRGVPADLIGREAVVPHPGVVLVLFDDVEAGVGLYRAGSRVGMSGGYRRQETTRGGGHTDGESADTLEEVPPAGGLVTQHDSWGFGGRGVACRKPGSPLPCSGGTGKHTASRGDGRRRSGHRTSGTEMPSRCRTSRITK